MTTCCDEPTTVTAYDATSTGGGTVTMDPAGNYTYTPSCRVQRDSDTFTYTITDADGDTVYRDGDDHGGRAASGG